ncbi:Sugar phosphate permease [Nakamurella panacisegetis]|uniref:Sugar phosphate permease n=1 Tax=Nakamurella panacisegetis TaxID=1090615 RepID=A0A1H0SJA7_9ACTN|nr:MFS transporter [Nakamurella panacisegetis]SDP41833.1 Sugar phosphate permease [Nakamurella panacisegetis]
METVINSSVPVRAPGKAWLVWAIGAGVYVLAVFHRSTLGVAGPQAAERLHLSAPQLSSFVMLQLAVYALMQVPTGILVDRFGPRRMLLAATLTMGCGELAFAFVGGYVPALLARGVVGCGDAMTYISVLRLVAGWFPARRYAVLTSFTGLAGSAGNIIATLPLTGLLHGLGWAPTFGIAGGLSVAYAFLLLRPATAAPFRAAEERAAGGPVAGRRVFSEVRSAWHLPSGRLGFWVHFTCMAGPTTFATLWGFPYLTQGLGYSTGTASSLMLLLVLGGVLANLAVGQIVGRRPEVRTPMAVIVCGVSILAWLLLIAWPGGVPPTPVVVLVVIVFSVSGPTSAVAFMLARDYNPRHRISTATGMVNIGGFCGAVIGIFLVGQILNLVEPHRATHTVEGFRFAFCALVVVTAVGLSRMLTWWLRTRAMVLLAAARGEDVPVNLHVRRWELVDEAELAREADRVRARGPAPDEL